MGVRYSQIQPTEKRICGPSWRPTSLSPIVLILVISFTIMLMVILAILQSKSTRDGGILFAESIDDMPASYIFLENYLPTIVAVLFITVWNWIDLDVKRLEPWYRLSQESGALGSDSVLLDYPAEFLAFVPLESLKRKQWTVFCTSLILVILSWVVTPLQSGIFSIQTIQKSQNITILSSPGLVSLEEQTKTLTLNFVNEGYSVTWLNMSMPAFTTESYALAPFLPSDDKQAIGMNQTWTGNTVLYQTDLDCQPAQSIPDRNSSRLTFSDGRGCVAQDVVANSLISFNEPGGYYLGYEGDGPIDVYGINGTSPSLQQAGCNASSLHEFLAVWGRDFSMTAMFCWTKYYTQDVEATVYLPNYSVQSVRPISERRELSEQTFNYTRFEQLIVSNTMPEQVARYGQYFAPYTGPQYPPDSSPQLYIPNPYDISDVSVIDQSSRLQKLGADSMSVLTPFAFGVSGLSPQALLTPSNLQSAFQDAHRMLFSLAIYSVTEAPVEVSSNTTGILEASVGAVVMVEAFTYPVIASLGVVTLLTAYLLCAYRNRTLHLPYSPNSIASVLGLARQRMEPFSVFRSLDCAEEGVFTRKLKDEHFKLQIPGHESRLNPRRQGEGQDEVPAAKESSFTKAKSWPWELRRAVGFIFIFILTGTIAAVLVLQDLIQRNDGLPLPSGSTFLQQMLLNFIPTAVGTLMEPFWAVLNRLLCIIQPFIELNKGATSASKSILLEYTSVPPQLVIWRALKAKHWLLAAVCAVAVAANVLTVGLSGLFEIRNVNLENPISVELSMLPKLAPLNLTSAGVSGNLGEPLQIMLANVSENVALVPWVTPEYYFLPVSLPTNTSVSSYVLSTIGIGSQLDCQELKESNSDLLYRFILSHDAMEANFTVSQKLSDGSQIRCFSPNAFTGDNAPVPSEATQVYIRGDPEGGQGVEMFIQPIASEVTATPEENYACPRMFIAGWVRSSITLGDKYSNTLYGPTRNITSSTLNSTFMMCKPRFQTANFSVITDQSGHILNYTQIGPLSEEVDEDLASAVWNATTFLVGQPPDYFRWHNDTTASDWFNLFLKKLSGLTSIIDPLAPPPDFATTADLVNQVYQRLFAVVLQDNQEYLMPAPPKSFIIANEITTQQRVFLSETMFYIVVVILALDTIVAIALYIRLPKPFLHRMPTSIAGLLAYGTSSHLAQDLDFKTAAAVGQDGIRKVLTQRGSVYGFGRYIGTDGEIHFGIDRQPYLIPRQVQDSRKWWQLWTSIPFFFKKWSLQSDMI
ncbi:hypothetical protein VTN77DRAFT_2577 [Rasamsonia byssochlamydoides]|uniref:uncharacterized protein n=1 Tax=Rasamsonia byssochlamydoides TaxID=89139 RepID=UPI003743AF98